MQKTAYQEKRKKEISSEKKLYCITTSTEAKGHGTG